ncbi:MAG TPA: helix-turn-helix domain-containing protein [Solirubrobacterales bacterium]|nr:helix-turn-helix domain-containing protein [Solirubrobacterales bacterium]
MVDPGEGISENSPAVLMARALSHPARIRILTHMNAPRRQLSPSKWSEEVDMPLSRAAYHFRQLAKNGCIEIVETIPRRGATEHVYQPVKRAMAWSREWEALGSAVKQTLAASALRNAVEVIGEAIDGGTFEALDDSILSWDTMRVDDEGWEKANGILARALGELLAVAEECEERVADLPPEKVHLISYLVSSFESPRRANELD